MGGRRARVFYISDLHMRSVEGPQAERARPEAAFRRRVLAEKWAENLAELRRDGVPFELVVFTGDFGDWGHSTDDPRACALLKQMCAALAVPLDRLFAIPGNHDIDRTIQRAAWESLRREAAEEYRYANTCQEIDEQARPRAAQVRFPGWSARACSGATRSCTSARAAGASGWIAARTDGGSTRTAA